MTRIEAIKEFLKEPTFQLNAAYAHEILRAWDTRETALRALVERMTHQAVQLHPSDPVRVALKPHIEALSRLLEQEP